MSKTDIFVRAGGNDDFLTIAVQPELWAWRFTDDNDGAQFHFGTFWRKLKSRDEVNALVAKSSGQRYMGRKRHKWYAAVEVA